MIILDIMEITLRVVVTTTTTVIVVSMENVIQGHLAQHLRVRKFSF